jgi:hypothetical protein
VISPAETQITIQKGLVAVVALKEQGRRLEDWSKAKDGINSHLSSEISGFIPIPRVFVHPNSSNWQISIFLERHKN